MREIILQKVTRYIPTVGTILLVLCLFVSPWALGSTYAGKAEVPDHILTYTKGDLSWDSGTGIDPLTGVAQMDLFDARYNDTVMAITGEKVVAPGTEGFNMIRVANQEQGEVSFAAVCYCISSSDTLPVKTNLDGKALHDTDSYVLPQGVTDKDVIRAVTGNIRGGEVQDFDISWLWDYEESDAQDEVDTTLGNKDTLDYLTVGFYIVVKDDNEYLTPVIPETGIPSEIIAYLILTIISVILLLLVIRSQKGEKKCE